MCASLGKANDEKLKRRKGRLKIRDDSSKYRKCNENSSLLNPRQNVNERRYLQTAFLSFTCKARQSVPSNTNMKEISGAASGLKSCHVGQPPPKLPVSLPMPN